MSARRTIVDVGSAFARHAVSALAGLLVIPLVAHRLGAEALGAWALLGMSAFLLGVSDLGLSAAAQRASLRQEQERARELVGVALASIAVVSLPIGLASWALSELPNADAALARDIARAVAPTLAAGLVLAWGMPYRSILLARGAISTLAKLRAAGATTQVALTALLLTLAPSLVAVASALLASALVETAGSVRAARLLDPELPLWPRRPSSIEVAREAVKEGSAAFSIAVGGMLALRLDVALLAATAPLAAVAAYGVASRAVDQSFTIAKQASSALLHRLGDPSQRESAVRLGTALLGGLVAAGMAALALPGKGLLHAWAGEAALRPELPLALALLGASAVVAASHETIASALTIAGRSTWDAALPLVVGYAINVAISVGGVRTYGVLAVAGGTLVGTLFTSVWLWHRARSLFAWLRPMRFLGPALAAGTVALALGSWIERLAEGLALSLLASVLVTIVGSAAAALTARSISRAS